MKKDLPEEAWNFSLCPPEEERACVIYEYLWEKKVARAFVQWRSQHPELLSDLKRSRLRDFSSSNVLEPANWPYQYLLKWLNRRPNGLRHLAFEEITLLLLFADVFRKTHWVKVEFEFKILGLQAWLRDRAAYLCDGVPKEIVKMIQLERSEKYLTETKVWDAKGNENLERIIAEVIGENPPVREQAFLIDWTMSRPAIKAALAAAIDSVPEAGLGHIIQYPTTKTLATTRTDEQRLKQLAAYRLMRHFKNDWKKCRKRSSLLYCHREKPKRSNRKKSGRNEAVPRAIYDSRDNWESAAEVAKTEISKPGSVY
ncbi:MAG: hypothetical protein K9L89_06150 [Kiritimatiellales bacterium]|nr:hypothetical protein [Kiritimatiellales bacterium]